MAQVRIPLKEQLESMGESHRSLKSSWLYIKGTKQRMWPGIDRLIPQKSRTRKSPSIPNDSTVFGYFWCCTLYLYLDLRLSVA